MTVAICLFGILFICFSFFELRVDIVGDSVYCLLNIGQEQVNYHRDSDAGAEYAEE